MLDAARGLDYLHRKKVIHSDLKPVRLNFCGSWLSLTLKKENIVIGPAGQALLCDFGCSRIEQATRTLGLPTGTSNKGTVKYLAPELVSFSDSEENLTMSQEADVWAFGMTVYVMLPSRLLRLFSS